MIYFYFCNLYPAKIYVEMLKHIVMFKVKAQNSEEKTAGMKKLKNMLDSLKNSIIEIQSFDTGINISIRNHE